jgi:hypothetical protein
LSPLCSSTTPAAAAALGLLGTAPARKAIFGAARIFQAQFIAKCGHTVLQFYLLYVFKHFYKQRCEAGRTPVALPPKRTPASSETPPAVVPVFDWALLGELLRPDWLLLLAAVALAIAAAVLNVRLPLQIGQLVNAVAKGDSAALRPKALATLGVAAAQAALTSLYIAVLSVAGERLCERTRTRLFHARALCQRHIQIWCLFVL